MENTIKNILQFIFEFNPDANLFRKLGLRYDVEVGTPYYDECQRVTEIAIICHEDDAHVRVSQTFAGFAYSFPKKTIWYELAIHSEHSKISIYKLMPELYKHIRIIKRSILFGIAFHHTSFHTESVCLEYLDASKHDDIFVLREVVGACCVIGNSDALLDYCDENNLMEHKMLVMRGIHEYMKSVGGEDKFEL